MRVLITGIDGFVGSHAAELLVATGGVEVHGSIFRFDELRNLATVKSSLQLHQADITDAARIDVLFQEVLPERVMHIAGQAFVPLSMQNPSETFRVNLLGGITILEAARQQLARTGKSPSVLLVSSGEVYGRVAPEDMPITEALPLRPVNPYAASKASLDLIAQQYATCFGVDVTIARPFNHAGPRQNPSFVVSDFAKQFAGIALGMQENALHVGNISAQRDFTDVRDVVRAYWGLFERKPEEYIFNVCSGRLVEIKYLLESLQDISGIRVNIIQDTSRFRPYDVSIVAPSFDRLHDATGWFPAISLQQTLQDVYAYWLDELRPPSGASSAQ